MKTPQRLLRTIPLLWPSRRFDATVRFPIIQQSPDLLEGNGFGHEEIDAAGESLGLVSAGGEAGQGDDQGRGGSVAVFAVVGARFFDVADGAGGFEAVEDGHAYIHEDDVVLV